MASFYRLQSFVYSAFNVFCFHSRSLWPDIIEDQLALPSLTAKKVFCFFWFKMCVMCVFNILKVDKLRIYKSLKTYNIENPKRVKINSVFRLQADLGFFSLGHIGHRNGKISSPKLINNCHLFLAENNGLGKLHSYISDLLMHC